MDKESEAFIGGLCVGIIIAILIAVAAYSVGQGKILREAYDRGHVVQCLGKKGYHWECD